MIEIRQTGREKNLFFVIIILLFAMCSSGCSNNDRIEEEPPDPRLTGKVIRFDEPKVYMLLSKKDARDWNSKSVEIGRKIISKSDVEAPFSVFSRYPNEDIRDDMSFTIISSYWVRINPADRDYADDYHMVVLKDENGTFSTCSIRIIKEIDTNILGELQ